jgi:hypothetical protein
MKLEKLRRAYGAFLILNPCPEDGNQGMWVPSSAEGIPYPEIALWNDYMNE